MLHTFPGFDRIGEENAFAVLARATELRGRARLDAHGRLADHLELLVAARTEDDLSDPGPLGQSQAVSAARTLATCNRGMRCVRVPHDESPRF